MTYRIIPAIMSGGAGARLWPASTQAKPKQFHALGGERTLIQETAARVRGKSGDLEFSAPIILANAAHADLAEAQLAEIGVSPAAVVLEPFGRNTAALGALAAGLAREIDPGALVLLLAADHVIANVAAFHDVIARAAPIARERIVTFGITPSRPEVGYGYIKRGGDLASGVYAIDSFKEKPNAETAQIYLDDGGYSWNSGMFFFAPDVLLREFEASADIRDAALASLQRGVRAGARVALDADAFASVRSSPLDTAVMEQTAFGAVAPADFGWADVGAWDEIWRLAEKDDAGNATVGEVITLNANNNLLRTNGVTLAVAGVENLIVVAEGDNVVIVPRARAQDVKILLELAKARHEQT